MLYAQVYLTLASSSRHSTETRNFSYRTFDPEECYHLALEWTNKAIENTDFFFTQSWNDLWGVKNKGNKEIILATGFVGQINYGSNYFSMMTPKYSEFNGPQGSGFMSYGEFLYKAWKDAPENINVEYEPRLRDGIIREWKHMKQGYTVTWNDSKPHYEYINDKNKVVNYEGNNEPMGPRCAKWIDTDAKILGTSTLEFPIMRAAELYLMRAEILAEISGNPTDGFADYNNVRERGNPAHPFDETELATYPGVDDVDKFLNAILRERTAEMAGEGHFWFDCKRLDKLDDITLQYSQKARYRELDYDMYWPYPQMEIDTNKKLEQKTAYKSA